jgi:hypothetical protein
MINPMLLTLYGEPDPRLGWVEALVVNAITNVVGDVSGVASGSEDIKTAIANFFVPNIGKIVGDYFWPVKHAATAAVIQQPKTIANLPSEIQQMLAMVGSGIPFIGTLLYQVKKGLIV